MLVLTRKPGQTLLIGGIKLVVVEVYRHAGGPLQVKFAIEAPKDVKIERMDGRWKKAKART